jgi:polysaccharide pyruvyl transferase WcaK-like protein
MNRTALIGWNAKRNVGDDAMTLAFIELLKSKSTCILLVCDKDAESLEFLKSYPEIKFIYAPFHRLLAHTRGIKGVYYRWFLAWYLLVTCNEIIIGGGTLFHTSGVLKFYTNILKFRKLLHLKVTVGAASVSVGPFRDEQAPNYFRKFAEDIDFISVRDKRSFEICKQMIPEKTTFYPDIALCIPSFFNLTSTKENKISVSLRQGYVNDSEMKWLDSFLSQFHGMYPSTKIEFITFCDLKNVNENDDIGIDKFLNYSTSKWKSLSTRLPYNSNPLFFYEALKKSQFNVCMRLHSSILSYAVGVNFITLNYHKKCEDFIKLVNMDETFLIKNFNLDNSYELLIDKMMSEELIDRNTIDLNVKTSSNHLKSLLNE